MPWAPSSAPPSGPTEIWVGLCARGHVVAMSETTPDGTAWRRDGAVRIERMSYWDFHKAKGQCSCSEVNHGREANVTVVKAPVYYPAPEGTWRAVCVDEVDLGDVKSAYGPRAMIQLTWEIEELNPRQENRPYLVIQRFGATLSSKGNLIKFLEAWRGRKFNADELKGFDLDKLVGAPCQMQIVHKHSDSGDVFANIASIMPIARGMEALKPSGKYTRKKDRKDGDAHETDAAPVGDTDIPF